ncbi:MAG TPA: hypothetical protein PKB14_19310 [Rubrivivax sp.]|nr:hypothetical protein [Rubrivivax sp.]
MNDLPVGLGYRPAATVAQFCADHNISRTHFYALVKLGKGPRMMKVGRRTLIGAEAAAAWRARMEEESAPTNETVLA